MSASTGDKFTDVRNAARPTSTTVSSGRSAGGTSLSCASLAGWPTASKVHFVTYQIDSNSNPVAGTQLDCRGIVSGSTIGSFAVLDGTDAGNSIGDVVEMLPTASWAQDLSDGLLNEHTRTGAHAAITGTSISVSGNVTSTGGALVADTVSEQTSAAGVTVDGLAIKDSKLVTANSVVTANYTDASILPEHLVASVGTSWAWQSWTPTQASITGGTQTYAKYIQIGKTVFFRYKYVFAGAGFGSDPSISLPVTAAAYGAEAVIGNVTMQDTGTKIYLGIAYCASTTTMKIYRQITDTTDLYTAAPSDTTPHTWANTDILAITGCYEAA